MISASDILSKPVINITTGNNLGTTKNLCFDKKLKKLEQIVLFNEEGEIEEMTISPQNIFSVGKDAIIIKNESTITPLMFERIDFKLNNPINSSAFNIEGELIGTVKDVKLNKHFNSVTLLIDENEYSVNKITSFSANTLLINTSGKKITEKKPSLKKIETTEKQVVKIMPTEITEQSNTTDLPTIENNVEPTTTQEQPKIKKPIYIIDSSPTPERILTNQSYLLGRKTTKTIYGINNEIIAKKDTYITEKTLTKAKQHAKLAEMVIYSQAKK